MTPADAVVAATRAAVVAVGATDCPVADVVIPDRPAGNRWVVVYPDEGLFAALDLCDSGQQALVSWTVNCVAPTRSRAAFLANTIRDFYRDNPVSIDGFADAHPVPDAVVPARADEDVKTLVICTNTYTMTVTKE